MSNFIIRKVAVLGAGVMGAQIAAHCANAEVPVILFDLPSTEGNPNTIVLRALEGLKRLDPSPFATSDRVHYVGAANYEQHLKKLRECDLIIEAIAEKMEWKRDLYANIAPYVRGDAIFVTNTSGLSINLLAEAFPASQREHFCGVHFFNPPRYMSLVELIPSTSTRPELLDNLETFLTSTLGKNVIRAMDTPNFLANRVGVFSMLAVMHHAQRLGLGFDQVDALTGQLIGRPKSATFRTADVVGLDTLAHAIQTMSENLCNDPWSGFYAKPPWLSTLIEKGALGQKAKAGVYRKEGKQIKVFDIATQQYRESNAEPAEEILEIFKQNGASRRFALLRASAHPQAQFLWAIFRDLFHYVAANLATIARNARDVDLAMRWGFGWKQGPFEMWQAAGWKTIADAIQEDIDAGATMTRVPLPAWVYEAGEVHSLAGSYSPATRSFFPSLPTAGLQKADVS